MAALRVRVFGKLHLQNGEASVSSFPTRRVEELLGYLLLYQGARHPREKLIDTLWPDMALSNGRASLSTALWRLRKVFNELGLPPDKILKSTRDWISLEPPSTIEFDLLDFQKHMSAADAAVDVPTSQAAYRDAIAIYKGQFCEGIYAEWCLLAREQLERQYLRGLGQLMAELIRQQSYEQAIALGQSILQRDPLREEVHRSVMRCFWQMGHRARAVRQFQRCARLLQAELQILPMPETISLFRNIVEDRLDALYNDGREAAPYTPELQAAFHAFLDAAADLDNMLDMVEQNQEAPVSI